MVVLDEALHQAAIVEGGGRTVEGVEQERPVGSVVQVVGIAHREVRIAQGHVEEEAVSYLIDDPVVARVHCVDGRLTVQRHSPRIERCAEFIDGVPILVETGYGHGCVWNEQIVVQALRKDRTVEGHIASLGPEQNLGKQRRAVGPGGPGGRLLVVDDLGDEVRRFGRRVDRRPAENDLCSHVAVVHEVRRRHAGLAVPVIAVLVPVAVDARVVDVRRNLGMASGRIERAVGVACRNVGRIGTEQDVLHTPAFIGFADEAADGFLDVGTVAIIALDPLHSSHDGRESGRRAMIGESLEFGGHGVGGDDQVRHGTSTKTGSLRR